MDNHTFHIYHSLTMSLLQGMVTLLSSVKTCFKNDVKCSRNVWAETLNVSCKLSMAFKWFWHRSSIPRVCDSGYVVVPTSRASGSACVLDLCDGRCLCPHLHCNTSKYSRKQMSCFCSCCMGVQYQLYVITSQPSLHTVYACSQAFLRVFLFSANSIAKVGIQVCHSFNSLSSTKLTLVQFRMVLFSMEKMTNVKAPWQYHATLRTARYSLTWYLLHALKNTLCQGSNGKHCQQMGGMPLVSCASPYPPRYCYCALNNMMNEQQFPSNFLLACSSSAVDVLCAMFNHLYDEDIVYPPRYCYCAITQGAIAQQQYC